MNGLKNKWTDTNDKFKKCNPGESDDGKMDRFEEFFATEIKLLELDGWCSCGSALWRCDLPLNLQHLLETSFESLLRIGLCEISDSFFSFGCSFDAADNSKWDVASM